MSSVSLTRSYTHEFKSFNHSIDEATKMSHGVKILSELIVYKDE